MSPSDPLGAPVWETQLAGEPVAVAVDPEGDVVALAQFGDELQIVQLVGCEERDAARTPRIGLKGANIGHATPMSRRI